MLHEYVKPKNVRYQNVNTQQMQPSFKSATDNFVLCENIMSFEEIRVTSKEKGLNAVDLIKKYYTVVEVKI